MLAVTRVSEICIGIVCAGIVLAGTDFGGARRRLAALFAALSAEIAGRFTGTLALAGPDLPETQPVRRELVRRVIALDPVIDEAIGESSQLRYHSPVLQTAVDGLFAALAGWRTVAVHARAAAGRRGAAGGRCRPASIPQELRSAPEHGEPARWMADPVAPAPDLRGGGADADRPAGRHAVAAAARRPDGRGAGRHFACARRAGAACRRSCSARSRASWLPAPRARLAAGSRQCGARVRHDRRRRALLDRDRMAERRVGHHLCRDRGHPVRAASRPGLRDRHELHGGHRPRRRFRGDHRICGAAECWRPSPASAS